MNGNAQWNDVKILSAELQANSYKKRNEKLKKPQVWVRLMVARTF